MKRSIVLALLIGMGTLAAVVAQDGPMEIEVEQLEDNLYVLRGQGGGGNTGVFVTTDGASSSIRRTRAGAPRSWSRSGS